MIAGLKVAPHLANEAALLAATSLAVDAMTAEVVEDLRSTDVRSVLLKGPALAAWLYDDGSVRHYADCDLLVAPDQVGAAEAALRRLEFHELPLEAAPGLGLPHARHWLRHSDGAKVDLHRTVAGVEAAPAKAWTVLAARTVPMAVARARVAALDIPARALVVALHAAQHGTVQLKPLEDLRRALERAPIEVWRQAATIADELDARPAFARGLRLDPRGDALAGELHLGSPRLADWAARPGSSARLALGFERLAHAVGVRRKVVLMARELLPSPSHMRWWSPLARRGRRGLLAAYVMRVGRLLWYTLPGVWAWRRDRSGPRR